MITLLLAAWLLSGLLLALLVGAVIRVEAAQVEWRAAIEMRESPMWSVA